MRHERAVAKGASDCFGAATWTAMEMSIERTVTVISFTSGTDLNVDGASAIRQ
jgi:hypothetical protein